MSRSQGKRWTALVPGPDLRESSLGDQGWTTPFRSASFSDPLLMLTLRLKANRSPNGTDEAWKSLALEIEAVAA